MPVYDLFLFTYSYVTLAIAAVRGDPAKVIPSLGLPVGFKIGHILRVFVFAFVFRFIEYRLLSMGNREVRKVKWCTTRNPMNYEDN